MNIKQLSVFLENRPGRLAEITHALVQKEIDVRTLSLADTSAFGILRLIVSDPDTATAALKEMGFMVRQTDVVALGVADSPGEFDRAVQLLAEAGVNVEYMYAFLSRKEGEAVVILHTDKPEAAIDVLQAGGVRLLSADTVYNL